MDLAINAAVKNASLASILNDTTSAVAKDQGCKAELEALTKKTSVSGMLGLRLVRRGSSNEGLTNLGGVQWEAGLRYDSEAADDTRRSWSLSAGVAGMHLNQSDVVADGVTTRYIRLNDVRVTGSAEIRKVATKEAVTSAAGVYAAFSQDFWTNKFHVGGDTKVRDYQLEGGVYLSGVMNGFSGMIMLSIIKPYAPEVEYLYAVSVIPFGGGVPQKGAQ